MLALTSYATSAISRIAEILYSGDDRRAAYDTLLVSRVLRHRSDRLPVAPQSRDRDLCLNALRLGTYISCCYDFYSMLYSWISFQNPAVTLGG
jgi:hypothetical protein